MGLKRKIPGTRPSALRALLRVVVRSPFVALAFGLVFGLLMGAKAQALLTFVLVSWVFAFSISFTMWAGEYGLFERVVPRWPDGTRPVAYTVAFYALLSVLGAFIAAFVRQAYLHVQIFASPRSVVFFLVVTLVFTAMFMGISLARTYYRDSMQRVREDEDLQLARRIQQSFLPERFPSGPGFDVHAVNISSRQVSGDFYDVVPAGDHGMLLAIADVSGKGFPAALLGSMLQASLRTQAGEKDSTAAITTTVNALATGAGSTGKFVTLFLAHLDKPSLTLRYTNAGHNPPLLFRSTGSHETLEEGGMVVGAFEGLSYGEGTVTLRPGDRLVLFTDGVTEAVNAAGDMFGDDRLVAFLAALPRDLSARAVVDRTMAELNRFLGDMEPGDDITMMALRIPE